MKMEYLNIISILIIFLIILKFAWNIRIKDIKLLTKIGYDKDLNEITSKLPENINICKKILKILNNNSVKIKENKNNKSSLYIAISNTIIIANIKDTFTRVQTIAHECLHSIQNRRTLMFNFIFSNIMFIYFCMICILSIFKLNKFPMIYLVGLFIMSFIYYSIRSYLEMDAMIKAKELSKRYIEEENILNLNEISKVMCNYEKINEIAIKLTNYCLIFNCTIKIILYLTLTLIRM